MSSELYQDLYKLEPGGVYVLRISEKVSMESQSIAHAMSSELYHRNGIEIHIITAEKDEVEFIPKVKDDECRGTIEARSC